MKILFTILLTLILIFDHVTTKASHAVGGEITWTCVGNGKYKFRFIFYTDCNGISPGNTYTIDTNVPGVSTIQTQLIQVNDLILSGYQSDGISLCYNCTTNPPTGTSPGLVKENIYESDSIYLPGIPPASGWRFIAGECCRFSSLSNITGSASIGFAARAMMFPFNGQIPGQCSDNSPYFVEKPKPSYCIGQQLEMNYAANDADGDQLLYNWAYPIDNSGLNVLYSGSYTVNNPFPGPQQHPLNTLSNLNTKIGQILFTNYTSGIYASVIKTTSFKCNQKVAEIYREFSTSFLTSCPPIQGGLPNQIPSCNAPFYDNITGLQTSYSDTVSVGDTVSFVLSASDFEFFTNGTPQQLTMTGAGDQFGTNFTDPTTGCQFPPCATLSKSLPSTSSLINQVAFNWPINCNHLYDSAACVASSKTYYFSIHIRDNYCYSNGVRSIPFSITVMGAKITVASNAITLCLNSSPVPLTATPAGGTWSGTGVTGSLFDPATSGIGTHSVNYSYIDSVGCILTDQIQFNVNSCSGMSTIENDFFDISPQITSTTTKIKFTEGAFKGTITISDLNGKSIKVREVDCQSEYEISLEDLAPGMYQLIISNNTSLLSKNVIKY